MNISSATVGADTTTEVEVREYPNVIELRLLTPRDDDRPVTLLINGKEVEL